MMGLLLKSKAYLYAAGAALMAALAFFLRLKYLENSRDRARHEADIAKAQVHFHRVEKAIKKEVQKDLNKDIEDVVKKLKEERYEEIKNLLDPNNPDNW